MQENGLVAQLPPGDIAPGEPPIKVEETRVPRDLSGAAKAAVVVRLLLNEGADIPLEILPEDLQSELTQTMGSVGLVDRVTLDAVVHEFADALESVGLSCSGGLAGALSALDGRISPQTAARLRKEAGVRQQGDPWGKLRALPAADLADIVQSEGIEVAAILLSKLGTAKAAELLALLPGNLARKITYAVSQTGAVTPEAVDRIGLSLAAQLDARPIPAFDAAPSERVGAILNLSSSQTRDDMLSGLEEEDQIFADSVRKAIFIFAHIPQRVDPRDVPNILRAAAQTDVIAVLASEPEGEDAETVDFLLSNISSRMAETLREEASEHGKVKPSEAEASMAAIVSTIRDLEQAGTLTLITEDE
jgi:flagellar motor switch protein FliG